MSTPIVSVVMAARNDDHGGNMLGRMRLAIDTLTQASERACIPIELVICEWNPPDEGLGLAGALLDRKIHIPDRTRIVTVPRELHERVSGPRAPPLQQYLAKNVGARRAAGDFVLATNLDILIGPDPLGFLAQGLRRDAFYRADRWDVPRSIPDLDLDARLAWAARNVTRTYERDGVFPPRIRGAAKRMWARALMRIRRMPTPPLHTTACGDFLLMSREAWSKVRGYPEIQSHAYVDGLLLHQAAAAGLREIILPPDAPVFHIDHEHTWEALRPGSQGEYRASVDYTEYQSWCQEMLRGDRHYAWNDENWGLGSYDLPERTLSSTSEK